MDDLLKALQCCCPDPIYDEPKCSECPIGRDCSPTGETWCSVALIGKARQEIISLRAQVEALKAERDTWYDAKKHPPVTRAVKIVDDPEHPVTWHMSDWVLVWPRSIYESGMYLPTRARLVNGRWEFDYSFVRDDVVYWRPMPAAPGGILHD